jgi:hypothetical protein
LYPYDIASKVLAGERSQQLDLQWESLPDYMDGKPMNGLVIADVSGSMDGKPMEMSVSLAAYIAERNPHEVWRNRFLTFSDTPELIEMRGSTISEKLHNISRANWGGTTNFQATFDLILGHALRENVPPSDMPEILICVSDMQFDHADRAGYFNRGGMFGDIPVGPTNFEAIDAKYRAAGYKRPDLVFWNVNARSDQPISMNDKGVCLVSGASPSILKSVLSGRVISPLDIMLETLESERYAVIEDPDPGADEARKYPEKELPREMRTEFYGKI